MRWSDKPASLKQLTSLHGGVESAESDLLPSRAQLVPPSSGPVWRIGTTTFATHGVGPMWTRREILRAGGLGAVGLSLPRLLWAQQQESSLPASADACIVIYLNGGPSHLDMWDMKPNALAEIRGEFRPIASSAPGVSVCEHLPRLAGVMHRATLVRSMHHSVNNSHAAAVYVALTGHDRGEQGGGALATDHPPPGAVLARLRGTGASPLPYVVMPYRTQEGAGGPLQPGFLAGFIGPQYDPFWILEDPNAPQFHVPNLDLPAGVSATQLAERRNLLGAFDDGMPPVDAPGPAAMNPFQQQAFELLTSQAARQAFQIDREPAPLRDQYGRNIYGQSVLLARRLIEAGTRVVTVSWAPDANATWDTHGGNFTKLRNILLPQFDAACSSLLEDLAQRGMLERTLVAVLGDFGRSPRINNGAGRDHWNACYTVMLAGGGIKGGHVHGASDSTGARPVASPTTPADIIATIYHLLGVDPHHVIHDHLGRPHPVVINGNVVSALIE